MEHIFTPVVTLTQGDDGNYTMEIDWTDSYQYTCDSESGAIIDRTIYDGAEVCAAVDEWKANVPTTFIIPNTKDRSE